MQLVPVPLLMPVLRVIQLKVEQVYVKKNGIVLLNERAKLKKTIAV